MQMGIRLLLKPYLLSDVIDIECIETKICKMPNKSCVIGEHQIFRCNFAYSCICQPKIGELLFSC